MSAAPGPFYSTTSAALAQSVIPFLPLGSAVTVAASLTAAGTTQGSATPMFAAVNVLTTVPSGSGALLPAPTSDAAVRVANRGAHDLLVYPPAGSQIEAYGVNAPVAISPGQTVDFATSAGSGQWHAL